MTYLFFTDTESQENSNVDETNNTYFVTESGEYFYQTDTVNGQVMTVVTDG